MRTIAALIFAALLLLWTAPPTLCSRGHCPALADGSCDPAIRYCGKGKTPLGLCITVPDHKGRPTCRCSVR